jgi:N-carbamoylputrescine amidase
MEQRKIKVGLIQVHCGLEKQENLDKAVREIRTAAQKGAQLICLQELFAFRYFCFEENYKYFDLAEPVPGPTVSMMQDLAKQLDTVIIASLFEQRALGVYHNSAAVIDADGEYIGKYRKTHIPNDPGYNEKFYFTPGDTGYQVFQTKYGRIGVLICWDQWFPEAARITSLMGAEILFYPTSIGWAISQTEEVNQNQFRAWQTIQASHAVANGIYLVSVNRTGIERSMNFWGGSFACDPFGKILWQGSHDREETGVVELDLSMINETRIHWPFLRDRRPDTYTPILNRFLDE